MRALLSFFSGLSLIAVGPAFAADSRKPSTVATPSDKMICKRFLRIGSLVDGYRTCKTKHEWDREHDNVQKLQVVDSCRDRANGGAGCAG
jgi:hypothetical protein